MNVNVALANLAACLTSGWTGEGPMSQEFERAVQEYLQWPYVRLTNSGTSALWLAYHLAGITKGTKVYATPLTCLLATATLVHFGADVRWIDVDRETGGMEEIALNSALEDAPPDGGAVLVCDWGGDLGEVEAIAGLCAQYDLPLIEDAAHAFGTEGVGRASTFCAFSFQAIKTLSTGGDGGALWCRYAHHAEAARLLRWCGLDRQVGQSMRSSQHVPFAGFKMQPNDLTSAVGLANLATLPDALAAQRAHAATYDAAFRGSAIRPLRRRSGSSCWLYSVRVKHAPTFIRRLGELGVEASQTHTRNDVQPIFAASRTYLPNMGILERELACLPVGAHLHPDDVQHIADTALAVVREEGWT